LACFVGVKFSSKEVRTTFLIIHQGCWLDRYLAVRTSNLMEVTVRPTEMLGQNQLLSRSKTNHNPEMEIKVIFKNLYSSLTLIVKYLIHHRIWLHNQHLHPVVYFLLSFLG